MNFLSLILSPISILTLNFSLAAALPPRPTNRIGLPLPLLPFEWSGTIDGHEVSLTGNLEEMAAQLKTLYPDRDLALDFSHPRNTPENPTRDVEMNFEKRNKVEPGLCCNQIGQGWGYAYTDFIDQALVSMFHIAGACPVGARSCRNIVCNSGVGIFLCNDNYYDIRPDCHYLWGYALDIRNNCLALPKGIQAYTVACGQLFDIDRYNVVVKVGCNH